MVSALLLHAIILVEGYVALSVEVLTIRQLLPIVGNNVIVTSLIIGIFLLFLAYGYRRGGQYTANHLQVLQRNFFISSIWLGVGLSFSFIQLIFYQLETHLQLGSLAALVIYLLLAVAPLVYVLGQTLPITMHCLAAQGGDAQVGGRVLHWSTIGSFLGAVLTALVFMNQFGVAWTVCMNAALLLLLAMAIALATSPALVWLGLGICFAPLTYQFNCQLEQNFFHTTNAYANYSLIPKARLADGREGKMLAINHSSSSFLQHGNKRGFEYIERIKQILFRELRLRDKTILVLGAGGFSLSAEQRFGCQFVYVDHDPALAKVVQQTLQPNLPGKFVAQDARVFLQQTQARFPVIISDAYSAARSIPPHLLTQEYFQQLSQRLTEDGVAVFNFILDPALADPYSYRLDQTVRQVFDRCMASPMHHGQRLSNVIYVCQAAGDTAQLAGVYTDDHNSALLDVFEVFDN